MAKKLKLIIRNETEDETPAPVVVQAPDKLRAGGDLPDGSAEPFRRTFTAETGSTNDTKRTVELSFSSEAPVTRYDWRKDVEYAEVLSHDPADIDLSRLNDAHPLLLNHDTFQQVGVVERATIGSDRKGRATVRFSKSQLGDEIWNDVKDGIRRLVSVGYSRTKVVASETKDGMESRRYSWQPYEISIVPVPADVGVGIGRSKGEKPTAAPKPETPAASAPSQKENIMAEKIEITNDAAVQAERKRVSEIKAIEKNLADRVPGSADECAKAIAEGMSVADLQGKLFTMLPNVKPVARATVDIPEKEAQRYSIRRAINSLADGKRLDGLEREVSDEVARVSGKDAQGFYYPHQFMTRAPNVAGTATLGGNIVATDLLVSSFIDILRNRAQVVKLGARMLDGLVGPAIIPRQYAASVAYWNTEVETTTISNIGIQPVTLTPKAVTGWGAYSKQLLMQSTPSIDTLIRDDLTNVLALAIDRAALVTSTGGPTYIGGTTGVATVVCSTAGLVPTFANMVEMEKQVAVDNADIGNLAYLTNPHIRALLKTAVKSTWSGAHFVWEDQNNTTGEGMVNGYRASVTNQLAATNTVGTLTSICSSIYFGNWNDLIIGSWGGGTDIMVEPYTLAATRIVNIYATNYVDLAVRHPESFAVIFDALAVSL